MNANVKAEIIKLRRIQEWKTRCCKKLSQKHFGLLQSDSHTTQSTLVCCLLLIMPGWKAWITLQKVTFLGFPGTGGQPQQRRGWQPHCRVREGSPAVLKIYILLNERSQWSHLVTDIHWYWNERSWLRYVFPSSNQNQSSRFTSITTSKLCHLSNK